MATPPIVKSKVPPSQPAATNAAATPQGDLRARIVSSSIGSVLTAVTVTPLDVVKVRLQNSSGPAPTGTKLANSSRVVACPQGCGALVLNSTTAHPVGLLNEPPMHHVASSPKRSCNIFSSSSGARRTASLTATAAADEVGAFGMIRRIFIEEGYAGIYRGLRPTLVMSVPNTVLYFSSYEEIVWRLKRYASLHHHDASSSWIPLLAGGSARMFASSVTAPLELLRTREAALIGNASSVGARGIHPATDAGIWAQFSAMVRAEGSVAALFRGLGPTLWRDVPFSAIYWLCIERFRELWKTHPHYGPGTVVPPLEQAGQAFVNGAVAGLIAAACTTPADVVKTRQQAAANTMSESRAPSLMVSRGPKSMACTHNGFPVYNNVTGQGQPVRPVNTGTLTALREIAATEGIRGLWRGNQARMLRVAPACAIMISSYELGKRILE